MKKTKQSLKRALISVFNKEGIVDFARDLAGLGFELHASGGTAEALRKAGLKVVDIAKLTKFPPILDHRVVTLHPAIHGGILARGTRAHLAELKKYNLPRFDLVCVDLYPVEEAIKQSKAGGDEQEVVEKIDIGGPTMIRAAAKNFERVTVICDPTDRPWAVQELREKGEIGLDERRRLSRKVFALMARYNAVIAQYFGKKTEKEKRKAPAKFLITEPGRQLAYAENRSQNPAYFFPIPALSVKERGENARDENDPLSWANFEVVSGDPSFISIADGDQLMEVLVTLAQAFRKNYKKVPYIALAGKHGNPCGAGISWKNQAEAVERALMGDKLAVMGGEVIVNFPVTDELAEDLIRPRKQNIGRENWGLDIILAPEFSKQAVEILGQREKRRLLANPALKDSREPKDKTMLRPVRGGFLQQQRSPFVLAPETIVTRTGQLLAGKAWEDLLIAWACCWRASSNTVGLAKDGMLIGLGCGQQDRIACTELALGRAKRAGHQIKGSVFASDGFFPYAESKGKVKEGPQLLAMAGCVGGVVPGDGKELENVKKFFTRKGLRVAFVAPENRGFAKH